MSDGFHSLEVLDVEPLTDDAVAVTLDVPVDLADAYAYRAGQHVPVRVPAELVGAGAPEERRTYSLCAPPGSGRLRIGVRRVADGVLSGHLVERLRVGDRLEVGRPTGRFVLPAQAPARHVVAVVAGSGITPVLAIVGDLLASDPDARATVVCVNRSAGAVMFADELADLKDAHPTRLVLSHVLTREPQTSPLLSARPDREAWRRLLDRLLAGAPPVDGWYLCGPRDLVEDVRAVLADRGVPEQVVHHELFFAGDLPALPPAPRTGGVDSEVTAILGGRRTTMVADPGDEVLLDTVLRARTDAPYACRGGVCGTCRVRVLDGEVAMGEQWALEPEERRAGYVLACRSRPVSTAVTVDFDA